MVGFYKHKICRKETKRHKINYIAIFIIHYIVLVIHLNALQNQLIKLNYGLSLYMLSTNWARVQWGITPLGPCTNTKNYWSARNSCASSNRNCMSYANYAATN